MSAELERMAALETGYGCHSGISTPDSTHSVCLSRKGGWGKNAATPDPQDAHQQPCRDRRFVAPRHNGGMNIVILDDYQDAVRKLH